MDISTILALIAAVFGGAGVKLLEKFLNRGQVKDDTAMNLRTELRTEATRLREALDAAQEELDEVRGKYYEILDQLAQAQRELKAALYEIKQNAERAQKVVDKVDGKEISDS